MDSTSIYYKNMVDAMTYDGNMIFGHDNRHPSPVSIDIPAKGWWWAKYFKNRDLEDRRFYAHEVHVPDDYMILSKESFTPKNEYEEVRMIKVNERQVAIPMTWFFKLKDMTIFEQWDFLREYRQGLPFHLKSTPFLEDALGRAYDLGIEKDFLSMFYDMLRDDPDEFKRRKDLLDERKKEVRRDMDSCLAEIRTYRTIDDGWTELAEELYCEYSSGKVLETMNFADYCEFTSNSDEKYLPVLKEVRMIHSKAWFISMMTDDYVCLCKKLQNLNKQKEFDGSQYTFEDDEMIVPNEIEKRYVEKKPNKEKVQITVKEPIPVHEKSISKSVPVPEKSFPQSLSPASIKCTSEKPPQKSAHRRNFMDWIVSLLAGE